MDESCAQREHCTSREKHLVLMESWSLKDDCSGATCDNDPGYLRQVYPRYLGIIFVDHFFEPYSYYLKC